MCKTIGQDKALWRDNAVIKDIFDENFELKDPNIYKECKGVKNSYASLIAENPTKGDNLKYGKCVILTLDT